MSERHRWDGWGWCERCGLARVAVVGGRLACAPPDAAELAQRRLKAEERRAALSAVVNATISRLVADGTLPPEFAPMKETVQ